VILRPRPQFGQIGLDPDLTDGSTDHGHGPVYGLALSADGRLLASGSQDGTVRLWEASFALPDDGELFAERSADTGHSPAARPSGWALLATLQGHIGPVWGVALSADGRLPASGGLDGTVRLSDVPGGRLVATHCRATPAPYWVSRCRPMGGCWPVAGWTPRYGCGRRRVGSCWPRCRHTGPVYGLGFGTDGRLLASGGLDGTVRLWEPSRGSSLRILRRDRRYERMDITGLTGVTAAQRAALLTLGALDHQEPAGQTLAGLPCARRCRHRLQTQCTRAA
jgi:WD40 repeat protein